MKMCKNCRSFSRADYHKSTGWCMKYRRVMKAKSSCEEWKSTMTPKYEIVAYQVNVNGINYD